MPLRDPSLAGTRVFIRNGQWRRAFGTAADYIALDAGCGIRCRTASGSTREPALGIPALTAACAVLRDGPVAGGTTGPWRRRNGGAACRPDRSRLRWRDVIATTGRPEQRHEVWRPGAEAVIDYRIRSWPRRGRGGMPPPVDA